MKPMIDTTEEEESGQEVRPARVGAQGAIEVDQVFFQYPNATAWQLENVSFSIPAGSTIALCGFSGSGKSSLLCRRRQNGSGSQRNSFCPNG